MSSLFESEKMSDLSLANPDINSNEYNLISAVWTGRYFIILCVFIATFFGAIYHTLTADKVFVEAEFRPLFNNSLEGLEELRQASAMAGISNTKFISNYSEQDIYDDFIWLLEDGKILFEALKSTEFAGLAARENTTSLTDDIYARIQQFSLVPIELVNGGISYKLSFYSLSEKEAREFLHQIERHGNAIVRNQLKEKLDIVINGAKHRAKAEVTQLERERDLLISKSDADIQGQLAALREELIIADWYWSNRENLTEERVVSNDIQRVRKPGELEIRIKIIEERTSHPSNREDLLDLEERLLDAKQKLDAKGISSAVDAFFEVNESISFFQYRKRHLNIEPIKSPLLQWILLCSLVGAFFGLLSIFCFFYFKTGRIFFR